MKSVGVMVLRVVVLTVALAVCFSAAGLVSGIASAETGATPPPENAATALAALLASCFLQASVLAYIIVRSRWTGWKLTGAVFLAFFGMSTVVAQIDSIVYLPRHLPSGFVPKVFIMGGLTAALFAPLAVLILGKMRRGATPPMPSARLVLPLGEWAWKIGAIAVAYDILYFTAGYYMAWKNPAIREYYGGGADAGSFFAQLASIWVATPWMFFLQAGRGVLWAAFALPVIRMLKGSTGETALATGVLFAVWSSMLLLPNPYMPEAVRMVHLMETASEDFVFGLLVGWLLSRRFSQGAVSSGAQVASVG